MANLILIYIVGLSASATISIFRVLCDGVRIEKAVSWSILWPIMLSLLIIKLVVFGTIKNLRDLNEPI